MSSIVYEHKWDVFSMKIDGDTRVKKLIALKDWIANDCWRRTTGEELPLDLARKAQRELRELKL